MKALWKRIAAFFRELLDGTRKLFFVVWTAGKKEIADILNDATLQQLALEAVRKAARAKLNGDAAWDYAFADFKAAVADKGRELGTAMLEALLQNTYLVFKFTEGNAK